MKLKIYVEDISLPPTTEIFYSKIYNYIELGVSILIIIVGIYFFTFGEIKHYVLGFIMCLIGMYSTRKESKKALNNNNNNPQLIISSKGIKTSNTSFREWSTIDFEYVILEGYGKSSKLYLIFYYDDEFEKVPIDDLDVSRRKIENILRTYRIRHDKEYS